MTPREFFNAWQGWADAESDRIEAQHKSTRSIAWSIMQQHAMWTAWDKKQSRSIGRQKPPWEKERTRKDGKPEVLNYDDMKGMFEGLAEKRKN